MKNLFLKTATLLLLLTNGAFMSAQVTIGANKAPESFSLLELVSGNNKGLRLPQMTTAQRDLMANPAFKASSLSMGLQIFNTSTYCVETWNGAVWLEQCDPNSACIPCNGTITRWAKYNVGEFGKFVPNPEDPGMFFQWNRTTAWAITGSVPGWLETNDQSTTWELQNNPCPSGWRVPTQSELQCLVDITKTFTTQNGINGVLLGTAPNQIFLPAVGLRDRVQATIYSWNASGCYWSSTQYNTIPGTAYYLRFGFNNQTIALTTNQKGSGFSVRCVKE